MKKLIEQKIVKLNNQNNISNYYYKNAERNFEKELLKVILDYLNGNELTDQQVFIVDKYWQARESVDVSHLYEVRTCDDYFLSKYRRWIAEFDLSNEEIEVLNEIKNKKVLKKKQF